MMQKPFLYAALFGASVLVPACTTNVTTVNEPTGKTCKAHTECATGSEICDFGQSACVAIAAGRELGTGDGTGAVTFAEIHSVGAAEQPVDLAFNPEDTTQLWAVGYGRDAIFIGFGIGTEEASWKRIVDPAAMHFMHKPVGIAMGAPGQWATCGNNDNSQTDRARIANHFMGPSLWTTDLSILGKATSGGLGSHIDMLHATPFCRGIAHMEGGWYWVFNAHDSSIDKYNFATEHEPGGDDHSDGEIYRYAEGQVKGAPIEDGTVSHLAYDATDKMLYVADTGNGRIVKLDTTSGTKGGPLPRRNEPLVANAKMTGTNVEVVAEGLQKPSGLEVRNGAIYVTDAATSTFHAYDKKTGKELRKLATDLPPDSLAGFTFGPDGKIWFVDRKGGKIMRIDAW